MDKFERWKNRVHKQWLERLDMYDLGWDTPVSQEQMAIMCGCDRRSIGRHLVGKPTKRRLYEALDFRYHNGKVLRKAGKKKDVKKIERYDFKEWAYDLCGGDCSDEYGDENFI